MEGWKLKRETGGNNMKLRPGEKCGHYGEATQVSAQALLRASVLEGIPEFKIAGHKGSGFQGGDALRVRENE